MANKYRGEIETKLEDQTYTLCLTLGALAELEARLQEGDIVALAARFEAGQVSAQDLIAILGAGLRGGGNDLSDAQVGAMRIDGGIGHCAEIVAALLVATFGSEND